MFGADTEHGFPLLCYSKCLGILLHGRHLLPHGDCLFNLILFFIYLRFRIYRSSMFFQVCSWGGYTFIINLIPMHALLCIVTGRYSSRLYIAYAPLVSTSTWEPYALLIAICSGNSKVNLFAKLRKNIHKVLCHLKRSVLMSKFPSSRH